MTDAMRHRGPDGRGEHHDTELGVSSGAPPASPSSTCRAARSRWVNEDGTIVVVFNGEIYNHLEFALRASRRRLSFSN